MSVRGRGAPGDVLVLDAVAPGTKLSHDSIQEAGAPQRHDVEGQAEREDQSEIGEPAPGPRGPPDGSGAGRLAGQVGDRRPARPAQLSVGEGSMRDSTEACLEARCSSSADVIMVIPGYLQGEYSRHQFVGLGLGSRAVRRRVLPGLSLASMPRSLHRGEAHALPYVGVSAAHGAPVRRRPASAGAASLPWVCQQPLHAGCPGPWPGTHPLRACYTGAMTAPGEKPKQRRYPIRLHRRGGLAVCGSV